MTSVIEDGGRHNLYAIEPPMTIMEVTETHAEKAEKMNGRFAMVGIIAAFISYAFSGQIIPGIW